MGTHMRGTGLNQCAQHLDRTFADILTGQCELQFGGDSDRFLQGAGTVGLALHHVGFFQVQVAFDKPSHKHFAVRCVSTWCTSLAEWF